MRDEPVSSRCDKCLYYLRVVGTFVFSHIGLVSLVVGYTIMGAFAFKALESDFEIKKKTEMRLARDTVVEKLWTMTSDQLVLFEGNWTPAVTEKLREFERKLVFAVRKMGYDGTDEHEVQWTFSGALLYSIIVITTIGYGNVAPKTAWGKVITILYAVVGIPLMLLCMSNIGDTMAQSFKFVYWKVCCYFCTRHAKRTRRTRTVRYHRYPSMRMRSRPGSGGGSGHGGRPASRHGSSRSGGTQQGEDEVSASSYYGDDYLAVDHEVAPYSQRRRLHHLPPPPIQTQPKCSYDGGGSGRSGSPERGRTDPNKVPIILNKYVLESKEDLRVDLPPSPNKDGGFTGNNLPPTATSAGGSTDRPAQSPTTQQQPSNRLTEPVRRHSSRRKHYRYRHHHGHHHQDDVEYDSEEESYSDREEEEPEKEHVTVPIWLCCALVTGYICGGAVLFSFWEGWNFLDSSYFCFVTLTTIGFGDLVPGKSVIHDDSQTTLALCALYLLFGMALLAMSFNLVQEQVTTTMKCIGKRIGIIEDDEDDDEE